MNFRDFINEELSKEGQLSQFDSSLEKLYGLRKSLKKNNINTSAIDHQIAQVRQALDVRMSATHKWYGTIVRIDQEPINNEEMWRLTTQDGQVFHTPRTSNTVKMPVNWQHFEPFIRFIEYRRKSWGNTTVNLITYVESRTVDIVPVRTKKENVDYYLIRRQDSGLLATVGGHIEEGELNNPIAAAHRELREETRAVPLTLKALPTGWMRIGSDAWTMPYVAVVSPDFDMIPSSDAIDGEWLPLGEIPSGLHFPSHRRIIKAAFEAVPGLLKQFGKH